MQAIILCAGRGTRMGDLTKDIPKPMLKVGDKNLIEYKLDILPPEIKEIVLVVGYKKDVIKNYFGDLYNNLSIKYVDMDVLNGTGSAIWACKDILKGRFLVMMGDDLYKQEDLSKLLEHDLSIGVFEGAKYNEGDMVCHDDSSNFTHLGCGKNICAGVYVLDKKFFNYELVKLRTREEWGLPQTLEQATNDIDIKVVPLSYWQQVSRAEDLRKVAKKLVE